MNRRNFIGLALAAAGVVALPRRKPDPIPLATKSNPGILAASAVDNEGWIIPAGTVSWYAGIKPPPGWVWYGDEPGDGLGLVLKL